MLNNVDKDPTNLNVSYEKGFYVAHCVKECTVSGYCDRINSTFSKR